MKPARAAAVGTSKPPVASMTTSVRKIVPSHSRSLEMPRSEFGKVRRPC